MPCSRYVLCAFLFCILFFSLGFWAWGRWSVSMGMSLLYGNEYNDGRSIVYVYATPSGRHRFVPSVRKVVTVIQQQSQRRDNTHLKTPQVVTSYHLYCISVNPPLVKLNLG